MRSLNTTYFVIYEYFYFSVYLQTFVTFNLKSLQNSCFPLNIEKLLRAPFLQNKSGQLLVAVLQT